MNQEILVNRILNKAYFSSIEDLKDYVFRLKEAKKNLDSLEEKFHEARKENIRRSIDAKAISDPSIKLQIKQLKREIQKILKEIKGSEKKIKVIRVEKGAKTNKKFLVKKNYDFSLTETFKKKKKLLGRLESKIRPKLIPNSKKYYLIKRSNIIKNLPPISKLLNYLADHNKAYAFWQMQKKILNQKKNIFSYENKLKNLRHSFLKKLVTEIEGDKEKFINLLKKINSFKNFFYEVQKYQNFFDNLFDYPLTDSQRKSILSEAERNLVIASAGSGKTSTLIGKFAYLIESKRASEEKILILAFNKVVQIEIERKLNDLGYKNAKVKTFHGLGNEILKSANFTSSIDNLFGHDVFRTTQNLNKLIFSLEKIKSDYRFNFLDFASTCARHSIEPFVETIEEYDEAISKYPYKRHKAMIGFKPLHIPSLDGKSWVRSQQELFIANSLYINGIDFEYEAPLEKIDNKKIHPDFYFPKINCYYEHYAIDSRGKSPFGETYEASHEMKEEYYRKHNIDCFSTNLSDYENGTLEKKLYLELKKRGIYAKPLPNDEIDKKIKELYFDNVKELLATIIVHSKENNLFEKELLEKINNLKDQTRAQKFKEVFIPLYSSYKSHLSNNKSIDFSDLINEANRILEVKDKKTLEMFNFKYILVDEFQDISKNREKLIKNLLDLNQNSKLFAVGDDWQSIYRFSGSDITLMTDFKNRFHPKETKRNFIDETHRFPKEISDLASEYIQENPQQIPKSIKASKKLGKISFCQIEKYSIEDIKRILDRIPLNESSIEKGVFIIYRNKNNVPDIIDEEKFKDLQKYREDLDLKISSIHGVKGLENDIVIVLGLDGGMFGFPRLASEDPIISMLLPKEEYFPNAEERRVMYVALTRAKEHIFIVSAPGNDSDYFEGPSKFFLELKNIASKQLADNEASLEILNFVESIPCPRCKEKKLNQKMRIKSVRKTEENIENGLFPSIFMGCSGFTTNIESPMFCDYTSNVVDCPNCLLDGNKSFLECEVIMESQETKYIVKCNKCSYRQDYFYFQKKDETTK